MTSAKFIESSNEGCRVKFCVEIELDNEGTAKYIAGELRGSQLLQYNFISDLADIIERKD